MQKEKILKEFMKIPGVGICTANDFYNIGLRSLNDLKNADADSLYLKCCDYQKCKLDRCVLYVIRCAIYFATEKNHNPDFLKWWNWKEKNNF